jgi:hypothetical protein
MKYFKALTFLLLSVTFFSCQQQKTEEKNSSASGNIALADSQLTNIDFQIAKNYYVKNTIDSITNPLIENQTTFDSIFGMATVMGEEGKPTAIDFTKQSVIAVMIPETEYVTSIIPSRISKTADGKIIFSYAIDQGEKTTSTMVPTCILIINKKDRGEVILNEVVMER